MIPRFKPDLDCRELVAALKMPGKDDVERFEKAFAEEMGQKHAIALPYGRTGIVILLEALGLKDKEIICPAYTCVVVPHAIVYSGNEPVFIDSRENDFNMDLDLVPGAITEKTGAIIATSIFGYPVDLDRLDEIRRQYPHIKIIQDCAHSFAAEWKGRPVQKEGIAAIFGLNISKIITSIFGGMVTTDDDALAQKLRALREQRLKPASLKKSFRRLLYLVMVYPTFWEPLYGIVNRMERSGMLDRFSKYYDESIIDMPHDYLEEITKVEARVGAVQLSKYRNIINSRRKKAAEWRGLLAHEEGIVLPPHVDGATYSHFVCQVEDRQQWIEKWRWKGMQLGELIEYSIPYMKAYAQWKKGEYPASLRFSKTSINFPLSTRYGQTTSCCRQ